MRRFVAKVDLRRPGEPPLKIRSEVGEGSADVRDGLVLSSTLAQNRRHMRRWPDFQRALRRLPHVHSIGDHFQNRDLALEWLRILEVTRQKILEALPGFSVEDRTDIHVFFSEDGAKHLVSRVTLRPCARLTELILYPTGDVTRVYYQNVGGHDQGLDDLYERGLDGIESDDERFRRFPHYELSFVELCCDEAILIDVGRGVSFFDVETGSVVTTEEDPL